MFENLCMNCMADKGVETVCPSCGFPSDQPQIAQGLPYRTLLQERYLVGRAKKKNGEGICYIGYDTALNLPIEIRECLPETLCLRAGGGVSVSINTAHRETWQNVLQQFLEHSRQIAHLRELSSIQAIYDIFAENHTAYTVSEWNERITLRYFVKRSGGCLSWNDTYQLFLPVISAMSAMHSQNIGHFGISPDSLNIMKDGEMCLGDFCISQVRQVGNSLPADLADGYAAVEQYHQDGALSEATDVYGCAASMLFALTGDSPSSALQREEDSRLMISTSVLKHLPPHAVTALANALQVDPEERTPTFEQLKAEFSASPTMTATIEDTQMLKKIASQMAETPAPPPPPPPPPRKKSRWPWILGIAVGCAVILAVVSVVLTWSWSGDQRTISQSRDEALSSLSDPEDAASLIQQGTAAFSVASTAGTTNSVAIVDAIEAPRLVGERYADYVTTPSQEYQVLLSQTEFNDSVPEGYIISQQPQAGEEMNRGGSIVVVVSKGAAQRSLPAIAGMSLADACEKVVAEGFVIQGIEKSTQAEIPSGQMVGYQGYEEGDILPYETAVVLIMSESTNSG